MDVDWQADLDRWLAPFVAALRHKTRARMCPLYVAGLIGPGDRKSVQPMAARAGEVGYDQLHHFVAAGVWDSAPLEAALLKEADGLVGDEAGFLVIDDTALPKKGRHSVGVAPQYASSLGKTANCQSLVSVTLASREVPVMVGLRLFLPENWTDDPERMARAGVPKDRQAALTKPEIAIKEIDRVIASGARFGCVLADAGYGSSGPFRQALSERSLLWAVGLSRRQNVYPADVALIFPVAKTGKPRKYHIPDQPPVSAEALLAGARTPKPSPRPPKTRAIQPGDKGTARAAPSEMAASDAPTVARRPSPQCRGRAPPAMVAATANPAGRALKVRPASIAEIPRCSITAGTSTRGPKRTR